MTAAAPAGEGVQTIKEGGTAIIDINGEYKAFVNVRKNGKVKLGKALCNLAPLIGQSYGIQFEVPADGEDIEFKKPRLSEGVASEWQQWDADGTMGKNNSQLVDGGDAVQALSPVEIEAMKEAGVGGAAILDALMANSSTYDSKTQFAQEKYRKRKARKYMATATLLRPSAAALAEAYFLKAPAKIGYLRADSLAMLVSFANVGAHARVLVVEACAGLVLGAVAERLGGHGVVVSAHTGPNEPSTAAVRQFNFTSETRRSISSIALKTLLQSHSEALCAAAEKSTAGTAATPPAGSKTAAAAAQAPTEQEAHAASMPDGNNTAACADSVDGAKEEARAAAVPEAASLPEVQPGADMFQVQASAQAASAPCTEQPAAGGLSTAGEGVGPGQQSVAATAGSAAENGAREVEEAAPMDEDVGAPQGDEAAAAQQTGSSAPAQAAKKWQQRPEPKERPLPWAVQHACRHGFSSCVLAAPDVQPLALFQKALPLLAPSASFVIFSSYLQPLAECMHQLQVSKKAVALQLQEPWWRGHQVLPSRTHPEMQTSGSGGYILSGIIVCD